jgi:hypothetical protein
MSFKAHFPLSIALACVCATAGQAVLAADAASPAGTPTGAAPGAGATTQPAPISVEGGVQHVERPLSDAEKWVLHRTEPWAQQAADERKAKKHPVRKFVKTVGKGLAAEAHQTIADMGKDLVFVFSVQDIDPYDKTKPPMDKAAIVLEANLIDGSTAYLHHFPDNSFAVEGSFADNTVMIPVKPNEFLVKYPNGATGRMVKLGSSEYKIYRSDNSVTTINKNPSGQFSINNDKIGFMGTAHPDETGLQYEMGGDWVDR